MNKDIEKYLKKLVCELENSLYMIKADIKCIQRAKNALQKVLKSGY